MTINDIEGKLTVLSGGGFYKKHPALHKLLQELALSIEKDRKKPGFPGFPGLNEASEETMGKLNKIDDYCNEKLNVSVLH